MLYAAYPLYLVGGDRAVLAAPDARCACSARWQRVRSPVGSAAATGWTAFWVVGLRQPVAIYALDFWEHTLGLALMLWGVVLLARRARRRARGWRGALLARRVCFGAAATMRTEALVYLVVCDGLACLVAARRARRVAAPSCRAAARCSPARPFRSSPTTSLERLTLGADAPGRARRRHRRRWRRSSGRDACPRGDDDLRRA